MAGKKEEFEGYLVETDGGAIIAIHAKSLQASKQAAQINRQAPGAVKRTHQRVLCKIERLER